MLSFILSNPILFNNIRLIIAGDQARTKQFVRTNLIKYKVKTVIDVGCGTGDFAEAIPNNVSYLGLDINKKYITFAKQRYSNLNRGFIVKNVLDESFYKSRKFDAVLLISMLHHLSDQELEALLPIVKRITRKVVIVADIIPEPPGILKKLMVRLDRGRFMRSEKEKVSLLGKHLKVVKTEIILSRLAVQLGIVCEV